MRDKIKLYLELMRFHKPVGIYLLLWPTLCALWISAKGIPQIKNILIYVLGVVVMRAAGCVINDFADYRFDSQVKRTCTRPLVTQKITTRESIFLFLFLCLIAFILVLFTNKLTILIAFFALLTAIIYPLMKRFTYWPQLVLGIAFSFSIPMAFATEGKSLSLTTGLLMLATILWTIAYDTEYAMADREDDQKIGIKSTAILFGQHDRWIIGLFQGATTIALIMIGVLQSFTWIYFTTIFIAILLFLFQQKLIMMRDPALCLKAFVNNQWVGLVIFLGIALGY